MGFLNYIPNKPTHCCGVPKWQKDMPHGTQWQCDECKKIWEIVMDVNWSGEPLGTWFQLCSHGHIDWDDCPDCCH